MRAVLLVIFIVLFKKCYGAECDGKKCIQKCCPDNQYIYRGIKMCAAISADVNITTIPVYDNELKQMGYLKQHFGIKPGAFHDENFNNGMTTMTKEFYLFQNGSIYVSASYNKKENMTLRDFKYTEYCVDYMILAKTNASNLMLYYITPSQENTFLLYSLPISSFFLFLVLMVYCLLPELRNLGGLVLMGYVGSLLLAYILLFTIKLVKLKSGLSCVIMTLFICYFFFATFCWMNVMSYDIWWTFRGYAKARSIHRRGKRFKYIMYSLYSWGVPLALIILIGVMNGVDEKTVPGVIKPQIPLKGCFIEGNVKLVYFYIPMLIMIIGNWILYSMTAFNIWRLSRGTTVLDSADSSTTGTSSARRTNKERFLVYLKLSALMGLSWVLEIVSSFTSKHIVWVFTDAYNIFIGLMIFIIFVCKRKILKMLKKRFTSQTLSKQVSNSFTSRSRSTLESNPLNSPLKPLGLTYQ